MPNAIPNRTERPPLEAATGASSGVRPRGVAAADATAVVGRTAGTLLLDGKYRLEEPLAIGGMGSVWVATQVTLERRVAVKFVDVGGRDPQVIDRFLREARLAAAIHHPNVVDILDFGVAETGEPIMVMELLEGETLGERLVQEPALSTHEVVAVMAQVLAALDAVHRAGILHSDMKPGNVMLSPGADGDRETFARLIDFGIAFSIDPASKLRRGRFGTDARLVTGTPEYMPPEQAEGRNDLDVRVDVYAASVILYEMLTGVSPFFDELPGRVIHNVIQGKHTKLSALRPDIPAIAAVVEMGMAHDRTARPESARELRRMLLAAAGVVTAEETRPVVRTERSPSVATEAGEVPAQPTTDPMVIAHPEIAAAPRRGSRAMWLAGALALFLLGGAALTAFSTQGSSTQGSSTQGLSTQGSSTQGSSTQGSSTQGSSTQGGEAAVVEPLAQVVAPAEPEPLLAAPPPQPLAAAVVAVPAPEPTLAPDEIHADEIHTASASPAPRARARRGALASRPSASAAPVSPDAPASSARPTPVDFVDDPGF